MQLTSLPRSQYSERFLQELKTVDFYIILIFNACFPNKGNDQSWRIQTQQPGWFVLIEQSRSTYYMPSTILHAGFMERMKTWTLPFRSTQKKIKM